MQFHLVSPDAFGRVDGTNTATLFNKLPQSSMGSADAVIVPISFFQDYRFNSELALIKKPIIVIDYIEYGWNFWRDFGCHIFGKDSLPACLHTNPEWQKLHDFLKENPPALTFKRELTKDKVSASVVPIEYLCSSPKAPIQQKSEFDARPFEVFNCWGFSHPARAALHGDIFRAMGYKGINVISDWSQFEGLPKAQGRTWVFIYSPYWVRQPISRVMEIQSKSKLSISLPGAGRKCFRSAESPCDSIMVLCNDDMAWSRDWIHGKNCIRVSEDNLFNDLNFSSRGESLYEIYVASQETIDAYRAENYIPNHVMRCIQTVI